MDALPHLLKVGARRVSQPLAVERVYLASDLIAHHLFKDGVRTIGD
jgi:hypothetical protein